MADDHSNPPARVWLDADATVGELANQNGITARGIGGAIVDGLLPAFYRADNGCRTQLTPGHKYWSEMVAYLTGKTTRTDISYSSGWVDEWKLNPRYQTHERTVSINRDWIDQVIIKKEDYATYLRGRGEPLPGWWFASGVGSVERRKQTAKTAANARHNQPGGSRDKQRQIREIWATGKYSTRDICAEEECAALGMSFAAARKALRNA